MTDQQTSLYSLALNADRPLTSLRFGFGVNGTVDDEDATLDAIVGFVLATFSTD